MWDHPVIDRFGAVQVPSLLIPAGARAEPKRSAVERAAALLPGSEVRWYEGADHDVHAQHPESLARDLLTLAERVGATVVGADPATTAVPTTPP